MAAINLSRKAWNNLIIITMLIMIFLFNGLHHKLNGDDAPQGPTPLLPEQSYILSLSYPGMKVERIGTSWRMQSETSELSAETVAQSVAAWQSMVLPNAQAQHQAPMLVATLALAGEPQPWVFILYQDKQKYYLFSKQQQQWFALTQSQAKALFLQL